jgi:hypothetical protein
MKTTIICIATALCSSAFAQEKTPVKRRISLQDISLHQGMYEQKVPAGSLDDFKTLAPKSDLMGINLAGYEGGFEKDSYLNDVASLTASLGFNFLNGKKEAYRTNPLFRIGVTYAPMLYMRGYFVKVESRPYDTLTSSQTGQQFFRDTVNRHDFQMEYRARQARVELLFMLRTKTGRRFSFSSGLGISGGMSVNPVTRIFYGQFGYTTGTPHQYNIAGGSHESTHEEFKNQKSMVFSAFVPASLSFKLSNKSKILKRFSVFYEARAGINMISIPELYTRIQPLIQQCAGARFLVHRNN